LLSIYERMPNMIDALSIRYYFSECGTILHRKIHGSLSAEAMINSWREIIISGKVTKNIKGVLTDFRSCTLDIEESDLITIQNFMSSNSEFFAFIKVAEVIDSPKIVLPIIFSGRYDMPNLQAFSTIEKAKQWMLEED